MNGPVEYIMKVVDATHEIPGMTSDILLETIKKLWV
jgi:hypothetical protein